MDWQDQANWQCNARHPPGGEFEYDGTTTHPLEVMFVPVTRLSLYAGHPSARAAKRYDRWQEAQVRCVALASFVLRTALLESVLVQCCLSAGMRRLAVLVLQSLRTCERP